MNTTTQPPAAGDRPLVADCPAFKYTDREYTRLLYRIPGHGFADSVEVIGDPANGSYEWVVRGEDGKIVEHSDSGYGSTFSAMRDGMAAYERVPNDKQVAGLVEALKSAESFAYCIACGLPMPDASAHLKLFRDALAAAKEGKPL